MNIRGIAHVAYKTSDMDRALKFYCDGLGFRKKFELQDKKGRPWLLYLEIVPGQFVELFYDYEENKRAYEDDEHIGYLHLSIEVTDLKVFKEEMEAKGFVFERGIGMQADNSYQLWTADPDGNKIEFMEYTKDSLQTRKQ